jgi:phage-related baseplate assembly protein
MGMAPVLLYNFTFIVDCAYVEHHLSEYDVIRDVLALPPRTAAILLEVASNQLSKNNIK